MIIACILSFAIGGCFGFLICALLVASTKGDKNEERN